MTIKNNIKISFALVFLFTLKCVGPESIPPTNEKEGAPIGFGNPFDVPNKNEYIIYGRAEKGPMLINTEVTLSFLNESLQVNTLNDAGEFQFKGNELGPVNISTLGKFYNEITGEVSEEQISLNSLNSISQLGGYKAMSTHVLTHIFYNRLILDPQNYLIQEKELSQNLINDLNITKQNLLINNPLGNISIGQGNSDENAFLLIISSILSQWSVSENQDMQTILDDLANNISAQGQLNTTNISKLKTHALALDLDSIEAKFNQYILNKDLVYSIPNLKTVLDEDSDGIVHAFDNCPKVFNPEQKDLNLNNIGDLCEN